MCLLCDCGNFVGAGAFNTSHRELIQQHYTTLKDSVDIVNTDLLDKLYQSNVLNVTQFEKCKSGETAWKRMDELLSILTRFKTEEDFKIFLQFLDETNHGHVVDILRG